MKIAIKNDKSITIGTELIKSLENLGGKNVDGYSGYASSGRYYYINEENIIKLDHRNELRNKKNYTFYESLDDYLNELQNTIKSKAFPNKILTINYEDI